MDFIRRSLFNLLLLGLSLLIFYFMAPSMTNAIYQGMIIFIGPTNIYLLLAVIAFPMAYRRKRTY